MLAILVAGTLLLSPTQASAQQVSIKTNLLYDAVTTPNIGVEVGLAGKSSINIVYGLNPWKFNSDSHGERYAKHWVIMPEYRWWMCSKLHGHFFGAHLMGGEMNVMNVNLPIPGAFFSGLNLRKAVEDGRYQGWFGGLGLTYGYQWMLSRHWNLEAEIGVGYGRIHYNQYPCGNCGRKIRSGNTNYAGLTKLGLSIMYVL